MEAWVDLIQTIGFPIVVCLACGYFIYSLVNRDKDEAKEREDKLIESNRKSSEALDKVADTIAESDKVNREISETNRLLVEKIEGKIDTMDDKIDQILAKS